jgi:PAS domain-containing protein
LADTRPIVQNDIELILLRQLAVHLATPIFIVDARGAMLFYNEPAEKLLGRTYEENDYLPLEEWSVEMTPTREDGQRIPPEELPLVIALRERKPAFLSPLIIEGRDGVFRRIAVAAFPIIGQQNRHLGAVTVFWEV